MDNITLDTLIQRVEEITNEKVCEGLWNNALSKAEILWDEVGGFDFCRTNMDSERRFWWAMLAYRYAHLLMNSQNVECLELASRLFGAVYQENQLNGNLIYLGSYAGIYRLSALYRITSSDSKNKQAKLELSKLWSELAGIVQSNTLKTTRSLEDQPLQIHFHNMFELATYFLGLEYQQFSSRNTFYGLHFNNYSKTNGFRLVFSDRKSNSVLYPFKLAKEIALGYKNALIYQITKSGDKGKWIQCPSLEQSRLIEPPEHTLKMLTGILYNPEEKIFATELYPRKVKSLLNAELKKFADCEDPLPRTYHQVIKLKNYPLKIVGVVHDSVFPSIFRTLP